VVRGLAEDGFDVALVARSEAAMKDIASSVRQSGAPVEVAPFVCDLGDPAGIPATFAAISELFGRAPLVLVNNAGYGGPYQTVDQVSLADWQQIHAVNLDAAFMFSRLAVAGMAASGWGRIVNISSVYGRLGGTGSSAYSAAKHALIGLTKTVAAEFGRKGITSNAICPGFTDTPMIADMKKNFPDVVQKIVQQIPAGRLGNPDHIADLVRYLVTDKASYINGSELVIDGGMSAHVGYY
jgi:3-oxoacyl-[acyl-carrier protein] reductase